MGERVARRGARELWRKHPGQRSLHAYARGGKAVSERLAGSLGYVAEHRNARHPISAGPAFSGDAFDLRGRTGFVRGSYALGERWDVTAGYSVRSGDVVASTRRNFQIFRATLSMPDPAISPDFAFGQDYFAYRLHGVTLMPTLGVSWVFAEYSSLRVVYTREITYATAGLNYYSTIFSASLVHRF